MAIKKIDLTNVTIESGAWKGVDQISVGGSTVDGLKADGKNLTIAGVGTFTAGSDSIASFVADAGLASAGVSITSGTKASVESLDFSKTTAGINYTVDGDDTDITFGAGSDTVVADVDTANAKINLHGFDAANDLIGSTVTAVTLSNTGLLYGTGIQSLQMETNGADLYKARIGKTDDAATQYWTTAQNSTLNKIDASSLTEKLVLDAQTASDADITLGKADSTVTMNAGKVASGAGNDTIKASGALKLSIGRNDGTDSIVSSIKAGDTVIFEGSSRLSQFAINSTNKSFTYGKTSVAGLTADQGTFSAQFGTDADAGKLQWAAKNKTINADTDTVYFVGEDSTTSLVAAKGAVDYNLGDSAKFQNIHYVSLQAATSGSITLSNDTGDTVDAKAATNAVSITLGDGNDIVSLNGSNEVRDTIATKAVSGTSTISGFKNGFDTDSDVLKLTNISSASLLDIGAAASVVSFDKDKATTSSIKFDTLAASNADGLLIQFAGSDTVKKVAGDLNGDGTIKTALADVYVGSKDGSKLLSISGAAADATNGTFLNFADTDTFTNLTKFDLSGLKGTQIVVGTSAADKMTVGSAKDDAAVWGGSGKNDQIALTADHKGTDHIWFSATDGSDTVKNFNGNDDVYFWGASSVADIAKNYEFASLSGGDITITNKSDSSDKLTLTSPNLSKVKVLASTYITTATTDAEREAASTNVTFATSSNKAKFTSDSSIYVGVGDNASVAVGVGELDDTTTVVGVDMNGDKGIFDNRLYNVNKFSASDSYAQYVMIGSGVSTLEGGHTANIFWGGSSDTQTFVGNADATDYFWFGANDGNDTAETVGSEDVVYLWSTNSIDDIKITTDGATAKVVYSNDNSLTLTDGVAAIKGGLTFMLSDQKTTYTYDVNSKEFKPKA